MSDTSTYWQVYPRAPQEHFAQFADIPPLITQILYNRGIYSPTEVAQFVTGTDISPDPFLLKDMRRGVDVIWQAICEGRKIVVYGDYDADGVTATTLLVQALQSLGANVAPYIPDRFTEGYGLSKQSVAELAQNEVHLVITVDCGIRSVDEITYGNEMGLTFIVTDHHHVSKDAAGNDVIPPAAAVINPKQTACRYPFKDLAGVGVAFRLAQALFAEADKAGSDVQPGITEAALLDLVAVGTVADMVPLVGENRMMVQQGLTHLNPPSRAGLQALLEQSGRTTEVDAGTIGFVIGPRLNAAGRLAHAELAYKLLLADTVLEALPLAVELHRINLERQTMTQRFVEKARSHILQAEQPAPVYVIADPEFNQGVVGLVASRLTDECYRPTLVAQQGETHTKGSGRSIPEFDITRALDQCADLLVKYGGHAAAAGFTIENKNLAHFTQRLTEIAEQSFDHQSLQRVIAVDAEINLRGVKAGLVQAIEDLQPFGYGNPSPQFVTRNLTVQYHSLVGKEKTHLKLRLFDGRQTWDSIGFGLGQAWPALPGGSIVDIVYSLEFNAWNGKVSIQLNLKDIKLSDVGSEH